MSIDTAALRAPYRVAYLIGQYPAINHRYLLEEIQELRRNQFEVFTASVASPDRPANQMAIEEQDEAARTFYVKRALQSSQLLLVLRGVMRSPLRVLGAILWIVRSHLSRPAIMVRWFAYLAEAMLVGEWMLSERIPHVHSSFSSGVAMLCSRIYPVTMSFGVYGFGELHDSKSNHLTNRIGASVMVRSNSKFGRNMLMLSSARENWPKLHYVALGIDTSRFPARENGSAKRPFVLVSVGRLSPEKAQTLLVEAVAKLVKEGRDVQLRLIGDGPDRALIEREIQAQSLQNVVTLEGWVSNDSLRDLLESADAFALSSLYEGVPTVLIEAMSIGVPCVAPCIAGIPELIAHGKDGLLFAPADVDDLRKCIVELMDNDAHRQTIIANARSRVHLEYDIFSNSRRFGEILRTWCANPDFDAA